MFIFRANPAGFLLLLFLLKYPAAVAAVQGELEKVSRSRGQAAEQIRGCSQGVLDHTAGLGCCTPPLHGLVADNSELYFPRIEFIRKENFWTT